MELHVLNHPLVEHKLTVLRDKNTPSSTFRTYIARSLAVLSEQKEERAFLFSG